jgi:hypothetical protein
MYNDTFLPASTTSIAPMPHALLLVPLRCPDPTAERYPWPGLAAGQRKVAVVCVRRCASAIYRYKSIVSCVSFLVFKFVLAKHIMDNIMME